MLHCNASTGLTCQWAGWWLIDLITPLHLSLRLVEAGTDPERCHGWLEDGQRLVLRQRPLLERLQRQSGYGHWCDTGGALLLDPGVAP